MQLTVLRINANCIFRNLSAACYIITAGVKNRDLVLWCLLNVALRLFLVINNISALSRWNLLMGNRDILAIFGRIQFHFVSKYEAFSTCQTVLNFCRQIFRYFNNEYIHRRWILLKLIDDSSFSQKSLKKLKTSLQAPSDRPLEKRFSRDPSAKSFYINENQKVT